MAYTSFNNNKSYSSLSGTDKTDGNTDNKSQSTNIQNKTIQNPPMSFFLLKGRKMMKNIQ